MDVFGDVDMFLNISVEKYKCPNGLGNTYKHVGDYFL